MIRVQQGDITRIKADAIVNAANTSLLGGGGVDGAIHRNGGPKILEECIRIGGCRTGEAVLTTGGMLPAKFVIHTVGPIWRGGNQREVELLTNAYSNSLALAEQHKFATIAFPNISTGVYGFPKNKAAEIAVNTVSGFMHSSKSLQEIIFVCFDTENYQLYLQLLKH